MSTATHTISDAAALILAKTAGDAASVDEVIMQLVDEPRAMATVLQQVVGLAADVLQREASDGREDGITYLVALLGHVTREG
jgi:hypothetical protein